MQSHKKFRKPAIFLMLIFIIPILASWALFYYHDQFQFKTTNRGTLINPALHLKNATMFNESQKKWVVLYVSGDQCDSQCENTFHLLNQVKKALGKHNDRVIVKKMLPDFNFDDENNRRLSENNFVIKHKIYLIDPMGNLFMYYEDTANPMDVLKDLKHVLEVSQIG